MIVSGSSGSSSTICSASMLGTNCMIPETTLLVDSIETTSMGSVRDWKSNSPLSAASSSRGDVQASSATLTWCFGCTEVLRNSRTRRPSVSGESLSEEAPWGE